MRAVFGVLSVLIVLALVGMLAVQQMRSTGRALGSATAQAASAPGPTRPDAPPAGNVREQSQQFQQRVRDDVARALEQGAAARQSESDK